MKIRANRAQNRWHQQTKGKAVALKQFFPLWSIRHRNHHSAQFHGHFARRQRFGQLVRRGVAGLQYLLEASTNLANWTKVGVRTNATGIVEFTDPKATYYPHRFYRVSAP